MASSAYSRDNASKSGRQRLVDIARATSLPCASSRSAPAAMAGSPFVGTPTTIADQMEEWLTSYEHGFNIMFPYLPRRPFSISLTGGAGTAEARIFRKEYEGRTLRENLGCRDQ